MAKNQDVLDYYTRLADDLGADICVGRWHTFRVEIPESPQGSFGGQQPVANLDYA